MVLCTTDQGDMMDIDIAGSLWVLVPKEPTEAMLDAGCSKHECVQQDPWYSDDPLSESDAREVYAAMIAAAPQPSAEAQPMAVRNLPALWRQRDPDNGEEYTEFDKGYEQASDECANTLERALIQPTATLNEAMVRTALRNLPQYIDKSGLIGPDKYAAMQCFKTLRDALVVQENVG